MQTRFGKEPERYRFARPTDIDAFITMLSNEAVGRWLWFVPAPPAALRAYFLPIVERQWQALADGSPPSAAIFVVEGADGEFLGQGGVLAVEGSTAGFEIGFQLPEEAWGNGVGTRLSEFLAAWAIEVHGAYRLQAGCLDGNAGSRKLLENLGMKLEGTRPGYRLKGDVRHDELEFGMAVADLDPQMLERARERAGFES
ncbi:MAG: GNAT family N-acetyltransferase [Myxococcota bacterium]